MKSQLITFEGTKFVLCIRDVLEVEVLVERGYTLKLPRVSRFRPYIKKYR